MLTAAMMVLYIEVAVAVIMYTALIGWVIYYNWKNRNDDVC